MEKIGLTVDELEVIFNQLKSTSDLSLQSELYNAYLPLVDLFAKKFELEHDDVHDLYNDVFSYIYNSVMQGVLNAKDYTMYFQNVMAKQCLNIQASNYDKANVTKLSLSNRLIAREASAAVERRQKEQLIARQSILMVVSVLDEIAHDKELCQIYGLDEIHIAMVRDFHGINKTNTSYKLPEIAKKYNISESRAQAMLVATLKKIREIEELDAIKQGKI